MGELADATINGDMCETCGDWLGEGMGFPRSCCDESHYNYGIGINENEKYEVNHE